MCCKTWSRMNQQNRGGYESVPPSGTEKLALGARGPGQWEALRRSWAHLEAQRAGLDARSGHREVKNRA